MSSSYKSKLGGDLRCAILNRRIDQVRDILKDAQTEDLNWHDGYGQAALHNASFENHPDIVELLLDHGADIEMLTSPDQMRPSYKPFFQSTPLMKACRFRSLSTVKLLLDRGANVHAKDSNGDTPLHEACRTGDSTDEKNVVVEELLAYGADPNVKNNNGVTPLDYASWMDSKNGGFTKIIDILMRHQKKEQGIITSPSSSDDAQVLSAKKNQSNNSTATSTTISSKEAYSTMEKPISTDVDAMKHDTMCSHTEQVKPKVSFLEESISKKNEDASLTKGSSMSPVSKDFREKRKNLVGEPLLKQEEFTKDGKRKKPQLTSLEVKKQRS